ncbi:MAG: RHS repeat-associated core domain-containing protein [Phycisphaerae bacterium]
MVGNRCGTTVWAFDTLDRKISETYQDGSSREFVYDLANDVVTYTDENGSVSSNTWDCMGRKTNVAIAPASGIGGTTAQSFQYNGLAQTTFARDTAGTNNADVTLVYDSIGRTVEEEQVYGGNTRYVTNDGFTSLPVSQFTFPNARQINSSFDALYRRQQIIEAAMSAVIASWQYFGPGRIATVTLGNGLVRSNMNNAQTRSAIQSGLPTPAWGSIATDQLGYDGAGRMIGKRFFNGTNVIVGFTSAYDMSSNKLFERPLHAEERSSLYDSYDSMNRLLDYQRGELATGGGSVTTPIALPGTDRSRNYNLDALGNWTSTVYTPEGGSQIADQRNHNKLNQITLRSVGGTSPTYFSYDGASGASNGNLTNDGTFYYQYDALNRPIAITTVHGQLVGTYVYDAMNRRVRKTVTNGGLTGNVPNGTTDYIWSGWQVVEERNGSNVAIRQYVWGTYIDECIQLTTLAILGPQSLPAGTYYVLQDLLYRAVALTDSTGTVVEAYDTDAYGNTLIFTAPGADGQWFTDDDTQSSYGVNEIIYCGYRYDPESELYYIRNRTYNPVLGRWLQRDPIGYVGGINLYEYVGGRAVGKVDPSGQWWSYWDNPITNWIGGGLYGLGSATASTVQDMLAKLKDLPQGVLSAVAEPLFRQYCGCKQQREGKYIGVNLGGNVGAFDIVGGIGIGGVQAIMLCASRQVVFYWYGGGEVGVGTPVVAGGIAGLTGGSGLYTASGYTGWFVGGQGQVGPVGGGLYKSWGGGVTNWNFGRNFGVGASLTTGGEDYGLLGLVDISGTTSPCCQN